MISVNGKPFFRRKDLIDPTPYLNIWQNNLVIQEMIDFPLPTYSPTRIV
jgi:hypothetical protein